jgi:hypothetical protein
VVAEPNFSIEPGICPRYFGPGNANWSHVRDGKIARIRVAFDPREILTGGQG